MSAAGRATKLLSIGAVALVGLSACGDAAETSSTDPPRNVRIQSEAMQPTLRENQAVVVDEDAYATTGPRVGDVIVLRPPAGAGNGRCGKLAGQRGDSLCARPTKGTLHTEFVLRVVAVPGDTIAFRDGLVTRNGIAERAPYAVPCGTPLPGCDFAGAVRVPPGHYYVVGDNRTFSDDSRYWGPVRAADIVGRVVL